VEIGTVVARGLHQVDNPAVDAEGRLYVTYSGARGESVPVSIFRIGVDGTRESFVTGLVNPTAMISVPTTTCTCRAASRGVVYKVDESGQFEAAVSDVGVACGLAFGPDGTLFVGDRSGTVFRVRANGQATMIATLPASVAAFHLAMGPDRCLYVTAPTLTLARFRLSRAPRRRGGSCVVRIWPPAGARLRSRRVALCRRGAGRRERTLPPYARS
jgi:sugar lactone lactonase YvrE